MTMLYPSQQQLAITAQLDDYRLDASGGFEPRLDISIRNDGPLPLHNITIAASLPAGMTYVGAWTGALTAINLDPGQSYHVSRQLTSATPGFYRINAIAQASGGGYPTTSARTTASIAVYTSAGPGAGCATVNYGTVWANGAPGQEVKTSLLLQNWTPFPVTVPVVAMIPWRASAMRVRLSHDGSHAVTSQMTEASEPNAWIAGGPIVDSLVLPALSSARYEFWYSLDRHMDLGYDLEIPVTVAGVAYATHAYCRKDTVCEPHSSMNPSRIQEMLFGVESKAAEDMLGSVVYDYFTEGGTLWHLIADLVARRGSPAYWSLLPSAVGDFVPDWVDPSGNQNPHPFIAP